MRLTNKDEIGFVFNQNCMASLTFPTTSARQPFYAKILRTLPSEPHFLI